MAALTAVLIGSCASAATLSGVIKDPSKAAVSNAVVEATNRATGQKLRAVSHPDGSYSLVLPAGSYDLEVAKPGFATRKLNVEVGASTVIQDFELAVAEVVEKLEIVDASKLANADPNYRGLRDASPRESVAVENLVLTRDAGVFKFRSGTFTFTQAVLGRQVFAIFNGDGEFTLAPELVLEKQYLQSVTNHDTLTEAFEKAVLCVTDKTVEEIRAAGKPAALDGRAGGTLDSFRSRARHRNDQPRSMIESLFADEEIQNLDAELLGDLYNPSRPGSFRAFISGRKHGDLRFFVVPGGALPFLPSPEEVALVNFDPQADEEAILYLAHLKSEYQQRTASSEEDKRVVAAETYRIETVVGGNAHLTSTAHIKLHSVADGDRVIPFGLLPNLRVARVSMAGADISYVQQGRKQDGSFYVILPAPMKKAQSLELDVEYQGDKVIRKAGGGNFSVGARTCWYPSLNTFRDQSTYDLTFKVPKKYTLVSVGKPVRDWKEGDYAASQWVSDVPLAVAGFNYGEFKKKELGGKQVIDYKIEGYAATELPDYLAGAQSIGGMVPSRLIEKTLGETQAALQIYQDWFGPAPYGRIAITQQPEFNFGQSWPGLVYLPLTAYLDETQRWELMGGISNGMNDFIQEVTPHEVAHQWWGHMVGWSSFHDQWLSEGFADFSAGLFLLMTNPKPDKYLHYWDRARERILEKNSFGRCANDAGPIWMGLRLTTAKNGGAYNKLIYPKGGYVMHMLRLMMWDPKTGDDNFKRMMHEFVSTHLHQPASTESFVAIVNKYMTPKMNLGGNNRMDWFFREWIFGSEVPHYEFEYETVPQGDKYLLKAKLTQSGVGPSFAMPVPLYAEVDKGLVRLGSVPMIGSSTNDRIQTLLPVKPKKVFINAQHDILEQK